MRNSILKSTLIAFLCSASFALFSQNVAINKNGNSPYTSAILDLSNNNTAGTLGFLPPYVTLVNTTTFQLSGTAAQSNGIIVYCTGLSTVPAGLYYWNNGTSTWVSLQSGSSSITGSGITNYIARWTGATSLGTGVAQDNGSGAGISSAVITPKSMLDVNGCVGIGTYAGTNAAPANGMIVSGHAGIGTPSPASSAVIDLTNTQALSSTGAPFLWPTNPNPSANIVAPVLGEEVYNTTTGCFNFYNGTTWLVLGCPCSIAPGTPTISAVGVCPLAFGSPSPAVTYTSSITSGAAFLWTVTATTGTPTFTGNGTSSINVTWPSGGAGTGTITLTLGNACGNTVTTQTVTIDGISGPTPIGLSSVGNIYTCTPSGATSYSWSSNNTTEGLITSAINTQTVSITAGSAAGSFTLTCVVTIGACVYTSTYPVIVEPCSHGAASYACNSAAYISWDAGFDSTFYIGSVQSWTVPSCISAITITAMGGAGGDCDGGPGGAGALITSSSIAVTPGHVLSIIVGGKGTEEDAAWGGGGGGGTFVWDNNTSTLLVAAGGGGGGGYEADGDGGAGQTTNTSAATLEAGVNNIYYVFPTLISNGANGTGGGASSGGLDGDSISYGGQGCGGAGWGENGFPVPAGFLYPYQGQGYYPFDPTHPGWGGLPWEDGVGTSGGFGGYGGGAGGGWNGGGGGGGYNGGGGGSDDFTTYSYGGAGGGSYCNGTTASSTAAGTLESNGYVIINY